MNYVLSDQTNTGTANNNTGASNTGTDDTNLPDGWSNGFDGIDMSGLYGSGIKPFLFGTD